MRSGLFLATMLAASSLAAAETPQAIPGGMSLEDYSLMREVIAAIREGLPDADQMQPGAVFQHVLGSLRDCSKNDRSSDSRQPA